MRSVKNDETGRAARRPHTNGIEVIVCRASRRPEQASGEATEHTSPVEERARAAPSRALLAFRKEAPRRSAPRRCAPPTGHLILPRVPARHQLPQTPAVRGFKEHAFSLYKHTVYSASPSDLGGQDRSAPLITERVAFLIASISPCLLGSVNAE